MNENENVKKPAEVSAPKEETPAPSAPDQNIKDLTDALKEARENSVPRKDYEELVKRNSELTKAIIDGGIISQKSEEEDKPADLRSLAKDVLEDGIGNLEYAKRALKFRDEFMKKFEKDPFAPNNDTMTEYDLQRAQAVADAMKECLVEANGSESIYTALFNEKIGKDSPQLTAALKRKGLI